MRECAVTLAAEMRPEEHAFLKEVLRGAAHPGKHLEIGTAAGGTLCHMLQCFPAATRPPFVVVDPMGYFPQQLETVQKNLRQSGLDPAAVDFRVQTSAAAFATAAQRGETFDFILIDGAHRILPVTGDLRWTRLLAVGGVVCLHDYDPYFPGVFRPANNFMRTHPNFEKIGVGGTILALRKIAVSPRPEVRLGNWIHAYFWHTPLHIQRKLQQRRERGAPRAAVV